MTQARVLVVDDDALVRKTLSGMLAASGYDVQSVPDGHAAVGHLETVGADLALIDLRMPDMDGYEVCRVLKSRERTRLVPLVLITAQWSPQEVMAGVDAGADDFVPKPIEPLVLEARVRALLRLSRMHAQARKTETPDLRALLRARLGETAERCSLSPREREVLEQLLYGHSAEQIGAALGITARTAKFHQTNLLIKLGLSSRLELFKLVL